MRAAAERGYEVRGTIRWSWVLLVSAACASLSSYRAPDVDPESLATLELVVENSYSRTSAPHLRALLYDFGEECPPSAYGSMSDSFEGALWLRDGQVRAIKVRANRNVFIDSGHTDTSYECNINFGFVLRPDQK